MDLTASCRTAKIPYSKEAKKEELMQLTKISPKHQITIPKEAFEKLRLEVGDFLEVDVTEGGLLLIPKKLISKDQAWFWTKEWQKKEKEADEAIARGEVSGPFKNASELVRHLRK
jgi:AbrB family looped-hinge helix DNA binding protein